MTSLQSLCGLGRKALIVTLLTALLGIMAAAQRVEPGQQGRMYGEPGFMGEAIALNVVNTDIRDILSYITDQYGINFVIDRSVQAVPVTVNVKDVPWNIALDSILRSQELAVQVSGNILRVADAKILATEGEILSKAADTQLDTMPLYTEFVRLNYARAAGAIGRGTATSGTSAGSAAGGSGGSSASTPGEGLLPIIKRRLSRRGSIEVDARSNSLIITDVRDNIDAIKQLISVLDQAEPQVEIEARIVVATRSFSRDIGVQLSGLVLGARGSGIGGSTLPQAPVDGRLPIPESLPNGNINNNMASQIANTAIGLTTGVFGTAQINMLITAGEQKGHAKVIATPRVTALNNRAAIIESKTQIPITTIQPGGGTGGFAVATIEYVDVPLKLEITPQITDVGTIVLEVLAENSSTATLVAGAAPAINTQKMQSQIVVPDGGTTVVGGVLFDDEREGQDRTPGLSRIPLLGALFKRKDVQRNTSEILFFITPRIYRPDFPEVTGTSGTRPAATILQPVPLGNPASNSEQNPVTDVPAPRPMMPTQQPLAPPTAPERP
ncbi:MAG TPA: type IV pilus secretin PilQ [Pyrinomonadaceae bacterium]|nr:type IV pilus secretin PilQ [Pyrinomonadaceae bacterium]HMP65884.1 type IV pilus secretin PilQ [Pyrinomonadaceae bacterium]